jgi:Fe-S cluster assembly protein SufD
MSAVLDTYQKQAKASFSHTSWVAALQEKSLQELRYFGFPTRHHEDWKYTRIEPLVQQAYDLPNLQQSEKIIPSDNPFSQQIVIQNGRIYGIKNLSASLPAGVFVTPLVDAFNEHEPAVRPFFDKCLQHEHAFHALNTALVNTGVVIFVSAGVVVEEPLVLSHWQDREQVTHCRHLLILEEGSEATVIEDYRGAANCNYFTNTVTEIFAGKNTKLTHYKVQREGKAAYHIGHIAIQQTQNSDFSSHSLSLGGKLVRSDVHLKFQEEGGKAMLNGMYAPTEGQHIDHHTTVQHLVGHCSSLQDYKGILGGHSHAVFNGKVIVARDAQHTEAKQYNKNILLSSQAEIDTKPQLEIFADDVICTHGATVGQLDEEALFYFTTRGISSQDARNYLIHAFAADNLRLIPSQKMADWMGTLLNQQLG